MAKLILSLLHKNVILIIHVPLLMSMWDRFMSCRCIKWQYPIEIRRFTANLSNQDSGAEYICCALNGDQLSIHKKQNETIKFMYYSLKDLPYIAFHTINMTHRWNTETHKYSPYKENKLWERNKGEETMYLKIKDAIHSNPTLAFFPSCNIGCT